MKPYRASGKVPVKGLLVLVLATILGGTFIGIIGYIVSLIDFVTLFVSVGMAILGFIVAGGAVLAGHVRSKIVAAIFGLLLGAVAYSTYQYADYFVFRYRAISSMKQEYQVSSATAARVINQYLEETVGTPGFLGYLCLKAEGGASFEQYIMVSGAVLPLKGFTLKGGMMWLFWLVEAGVVMGVPIWAARDAAGGYYCESGPGWYGISEQIGRVQLELEDQFLARLQAGNYASAGEFLVREEETDHPTLEICMRNYPPNPESDVLLILRKTRLDNDGTVRRKVVLEGEVSAQEYAQLTNSLTQRAAQVAEPEATAD